MKLKNINNEIVVNLFKNRSRGVLFCVIIVFLIGVIKYFSPNEMNFFIFYFIPIMYIGWHYDRKYVVIMSLWASLVWLASDSLSGPDYSLEFFRYWNVSVRLLSFLVMGFFVFEIKSKLETEKKLTIKLERSIKQIKVLSGLLPICASCKKIRNDSGYWNKIEEYISEHTDAKFSHSVCPECLEKLYPSITEKRKQKSERADKEKEDKNEV